MNLLTNETFVPDATAAEAVTTDRLWYKDAIIYQLQVKSFFDANNDGVGDFAGLLQKLDYIAALGVNTIWLLPFYPSPRRDDGYDIADYRGVDPEYGTLADVRRFIRAAHDRGMRVITELVVNHTSDQHPWFQRARTSPPGSSARRFYVWSDTDQRYNGTRVIFIDSERSNWTWDPAAGAYFWHRFYSHQPDLNFDNPRVLREVLSVLRFWADLGVDGLRLDAVPYLCEREGTNNENLPETHAVLKQIRAELDAHYPDKMLLAEANQWPEDTKDYFGEGDECHMAFHFPLMPRMYLAIAREDRFPITDILRQTPDIPANCQWAVFLRNHDELTLEMVTNSERDFLWDTYASDRRARINLGIRRRLAPLMEHDRRRVELMNHLLLTMPGTPVIYYGDEIGMGDNIHLGDRNGVRTPMQWSPDRNGGFSRADPSRLYAPPIMDPLYGFEAVNVEAQAADPHSLLMWMRRTIATRRQHKAFGRGTFRLLYPKNRKILAYLREHEGETLLCVANLARTPQPVELDLAEFDGRIPIELEGASVFPPVGQLPYLLTLSPYGFYWFNLVRQADWPSLHTPTPEPLPEYQTIVLRHDLAEGLLAARQTLEREILPPYLALRRWYDVQDGPPAQARLELLARLPERDLALAEVEADGPSGTSRWLLPLGVAWEDASTPLLSSQLALARVRRGPRVGLLTDAFALPEWARLVLRGLAAGAHLATDAGAIRFEPTAAMADITLAADAEVRILSPDQTNATLVVGDSAVLTLARRVGAGPHPEAEMGRYLIAAGFPYVPPLLGEIARVTPEGTRYSLAIVQGFVRNQGDAWTWTNELLMRGLSDIADVPESAEPTPGTDAHADYAAFASLLGQRIGAMHAALAQPTEDANFAPEKARDAVAQTWVSRTLARLDAAYSVLAAHADKLASATTDVARAQAARGSLAATLPTLAAAGIGSVLTRIHGNLGLGRVLVVAGEISLIGFEGDRGRPLAERRAKASPLRDVAAMLRSFDSVAATVERRSRESHAHLPDARRNAFLDTFVERASEAFLAGYQQACHMTLDPDATTRLLTLFLLEHAAREIAVEAAVRPAWIEVPLRGLVRMLDRLSTAAEHTT